MESVNPSHVPVEHNPEWIPWEGRNRTGSFADRIMETFRLGLLQPFTFADTLLNHRSLARPWAFAMLIFLPCYGLAYLLGRATFKVLGVALHLPSLETSGAEAWLQIAILPLLPFVLTAIFHFFLWLFGAQGTPRAYRLTFRLVAYSLGFIAPLLWLPLVNLAAIPVWIGYLGFTLARLHRIETWRAMAAVIAPAATCMCLVLPTMFAWAYHLTSWMH